MADPFEPLFPVGPLVLFLSPVPWEVLDRMTPAIRIACMTAPKLIDDVVVVTSTYREPVGNRPSYHASGYAIDIRTGITPDRRTVLIHRPGSIDSHEPMSVAASWRRAIAERLGNEWDVVFGDSSHVDHIHIEWDQIKRSTRWGRG